MKYLEERAALLRIKECDLRLDALLECETSVDKGIHVGGAFSAIPPMAALYYGGMMDYDPRHPTDPGQDIFILSKGHAVAALAAVYADVGYISREDLYHSRGYGALIKGHPGPVIPGVPVATGPLGHGISIACGYAWKRKTQGWGNVYCLVGDGELQEGSCWEGLLLAADKNLSNLCVIVDKNNGQSDNTKALVVGLGDLRKKFEGLGYRVMDAWADEPESLLTALEIFGTKPQGAAPTAIICHSIKGIGGVLDITGLHKTEMKGELLEKERKAQEQKRDRFIARLNEFDREVIAQEAGKMGLQIQTDENGRITDCRRVSVGKLVQKAPVRNKKLEYSGERWKPLDRGQKYNTFRVMKEAMEILAEDPRVYTIDSDLSNASGMYDGAVMADRNRALNVGIAECNMMCVGEALASEGGNVWMSTFAPFFDQRALRRIAVSYQEREEAIADGWLNQGHNLDMTFLATSANLETGVNGATHMGNDDENTVRQLAQIKVIDAGCPQFLQAVLRWIAEGNRGLVYLRTMKTAIKPIYPENFTFTYGKAYYLKKYGNAQAVIVTAGHGLTEALKAEEMLYQKGILVNVLDMPSLDEEECLRLAEGELPVIFAEQNNGALLEQFSRLAVTKTEIRAKVAGMNTRTQEGELQYIPSGTYGQLLEQLGLTSEDIVKKVSEMVKEERQYG